MNPRRRRINRLRRKWVKVTPPTGGEIWFTRAELSASSVDVGNIPKGLWRRP